MHLQLPHSRLCGGNNQKDVYCPNQENSLRQLSKRCDGRNECRVMNNSTFTIKKLVTFGRTADY